MLQCSECNRIIVDSTADGGWKLRARMVIFDESGQAVAICPTCKHKVPVPVVLGDINTLPKPKLYISSDRQGAV